MNEPKTMRVEIAADWWLLAGAAIARLTYDKGRDGVPRYNSGPDARGYHITLFDPQRIGRVVGDLHFIRGDEAVVVELRVEVQFYDYCADLCKFLDLLIGEANVLQRGYEPSAEQLVERYYRARAAGHKVTLRQLAEEHRFNYSYLRAAKVVYDKAGKWGSKKQKSLDTPSTKTID